MDVVAQKRYLIAGYGLPAEFGINTLYGLGVPPSRIAVLTHEEDERNIGLISAAKLRGVALCQKPVKDSLVEEWVRCFSPDILLSLHYRARIPETILSIPPLGGVNLHPSLLPNYRGTNSVAWVLINGESETGFSYHRMTSDFDEGNILLQVRIPIYQHDTAFSLFHRQIVLAIPRLEEVITMMISGQSGEKQCLEGTYFTRELPCGGVIDTSWDLARIDRFIRAMLFPPFPPASVLIKGTKYMVSSLSEYVDIAETNDLCIRR